MTLSRQMQPTLPDKARKIELHGSNYCQLTEDYLAAKLIVAADLPQISKSRWQQKHLS